MVLRTEAMARSRAMAAAGVRGLAGICTLERLGGGAARAGTPGVSLGRGACLGLRRGQADVVVHDVLRVRTGRRRLVIHDQGVLHREDRVLLGVLVLTVEDLG